MFRVFQDFARIACGRSVRDRFRGRQWRYRGKLAQKMLKPGMEHLFCKATTYMFLFCSEERISPLSALMVTLFVFDGRVFFRTF